jgi:DNA-binding XRE family transcriptional regulator
MSKKLGTLVREARTAKGLTQAALADKVGGITSSDVGKIERGEKEPAQEILKKMAKVLGVTQKSLLDAAAGSGAKASSSAKTSGSGKTTAKKKTSSTTSSSKTLTLTATEKKLVELYRKADSSTKKAAMNLLKGEGNALELFGTLLTGKNDVSSMAGDLLGSLLSGKGSGTTKGPVIPEEDNEEESRNSQGESPEGQGS